MSRPYLLPTHLPLLARHHLASFDALWHYKGDWFEAPNTERGGWSGVNYIELADDNGNVHGFYLKRQESHCRRTWLRPIQGEPTFIREFKILQHLNLRHVRKIKTPTLVFFASQKDKAILLTGALTGYVSADEWLKAYAVTNPNDKRALIAAAAKAVRNLHQAGVLHRSLYTKHLFVKNTPHLVDKDFEVAVIDFEKSRISAGMAWFGLSDLITLNYRTPELSRTNKLYFFKQYFGLTRINAWYKALCCYVDYVSNKKSL